MPRIVSFSFFSNSLRPYQATPYKVCPSVMPRSTPPFQEASHPRRPLHACIFRNTLSPSQPGHLFSGGVVAVPPSPSAEASSGWDGFKALCCAVLGRFDNGFRRGWVRGRKREGHIEVYFECREEQEQRLAQLLSSLRTELPPRPIFVWPSLGFGKLSLVVGLSPLRSHARAPPQWIKPISIVSDSYERGDLIRRMPNAHDPTVLAATEATTFSDSDHSITIGFGYRTLLTTTGRKVDALSFVPLAQLEECCSRLIEALRKLM
ncbi:hypothetical protein VNO77_02498 [Canavalia gladiata]|uniref:Uncharacterized protein n=1 Tax=Canavalia gladiata TaxID=3824 RepID=A0AAN9R341_CANGL